MYLNIRFIIPIIPLNSMGGICFFTKYSRVIDSFLQRNDNDESKMAKNYFAPKT